MAPLILMYHRIAQTDLDPWSLAVTPRHFAEHLSVLRRTRRPLAMSDFADQFHANTLPDEAVAVTFDDGYVDNLIFGKPRLEAADIPATVFVATGFIGQPHGFWWDELAELILCGIADEKLEGIPNISQSIVLGPMDRTGRTRHWRSSKGSPTPRQRAMIELWSLCNALKLPRRTQTMEWLRRRADANSRRDIGRPMNELELGGLILDGLVEIGGHTVTHPALAEIPLELAKQEIADSLVTCSMLAGKPIRGFAYPFGIDSPAIHEATRRYGVSYALGITRQAVRPAANPFALPRIQIPDLDGDGFGALLRNFGS